MFYATANSGANIGPLPTVLAEFMMVGRIDARRIDQGRSTQDAQLLMLTSFALPGIE
jgi:hypothetical protein